VSRSITATWPYRTSLKTLPTGDCELPQWRSLYATASVRSGRLDDWAGGDALSRQRVRLGRSQTSPTPPALRLGGPLRGRRGRPRRNRNGAYDAYGCPRIALHRSRSRHQRSRRRDELRDDPLLGRWADRNGHPQSSRTAEHDRSPDAGRVRGRDSRGDARREREGDSRSRRREIVLRCLRLRRRFSPLGRAHHYRRTLGSRQGLHALLRLRSHPGVHVDVADS
jgi:hypothetical protein